MNDLITILIVEDEPLTRDAISHIIREHFEKENILFISASNGVEALEKLREFPSDILLTDISMPEMDGIELVKKVDQLYPDVVKIIISGYDDFQYAKNSIRFHVMDYLLKPVDNQELIQTIAKGIHEVQEAKERNRTTGLMDVHQSGKLSFLYSTSIIHEMMLAIKTRNETAIHKTVDKIAFYLS